MRATAAVLLGPLRTLAYGRRFLLNVLVVLGAAQSSLFICHRSTVGNFFLKKLTRRVVGAEQYLVALFGHNISDWLGFSAEKLTQLTDLLWGMGLLIGLNLSVHFVFYSHFLGEI